MSDLALTPEQYVEQSGMACPSCGDTRFINHTDAEPQITPNSVAVQVHCTECGATWLDEFMLTGYTNLERPEVMDGTV